jgi:signal transduction histidine kinase/ActR/RegA family two-component response regulator
VSDTLDKKKSSTEELERQVTGLRSRLEKLGGEVVRADYKVMHLTQEVRRSRKAFSFLTGFQYSTSRAPSLEELYRIALKAIVSELWMKRATVFEFDSTGSRLVQVASLGYSADEEVPVLELPAEDKESWSKPQLINGETAEHPWIEQVRQALGLPYFVWIPDTRHGKMETVLVAGTLSEDPAQAPKLTGHDLDLFISMCAILWVDRMNLLAREALEKQVLYESLLHEVSTTLLKDYDAPAAHLDDVLARVGRTWSLDRVRILQRQAGERMSEVTHEWCAEEAPCPERAGSVFLEDVPRWREAMAGGKTIQIDTVSQLPDDEAAPFMSEGIRSLLLIPTRVQGTVVGWCSFERCSSGRPWSTEDRQLLEVIGGLISGALSREREIEERTQLEAEYHHSKKMEAVGQLAGGVAHDFNNLLTTIQGYAQLLASRLPEEYRELPGLNEIVMASERAAALTRQLLSFSRRDTATTGPVDLNGTITETMKLVSRMLGDGVSVEFDLGDSMNTIVGDVQQINQLVMNLAINARDAMQPKGGTITITTRQMAAVDSLARRFTVPGVDQCQMLRIADTGHGMDDETKERIFEPFFTTKDSGRGTGLGLSIAFSVARRHGGFIDVESELGRGTAFTIYLPVREPAEEDAAHEKAMHKSSEAGTETILVVEDDDGVRAMVRDALEVYGYRVVAACNGREALERVERDSEEVSLVVTDVLMPEMGGREMWERLRRGGCDVPLIVMSGFPDAEDVDALSRDATTYLQKPFGPRDVSRAVRITLDSMRGRCERSGDTTR